MSSRSIIPDWAALSVIVGTVTVLMSFGAMFVTDQDWTPTLMAFGTFLLGVGLWRVERAIK